VDDRLQRCFARRRSTKTFDGEPLPAASVARILAAVGPAERERFHSGRLRRPAGAPGPPRRVVPSPGGLETVNAYAIGSLVEGPISGRVARYDHRRHEVALLGPTPPPAELRSLFSLDSDGDPQLLLVWVTDPRGALARYGARALRLVLQEVGHAAQNVALRLAADGLAGYPLGGVLDREVLALLGLRQFDLWVAGGFACGRNRL
jgi:nitroreductase